MKKEDLRTVIYPNSVGQCKFHMWLKKEEVTRVSNESNQTNQYAVALVESGGGSMVEIPSHNITFLD